MKIHPDKVSVNHNNDPIFPDTSMMNNKNLKGDFTQNVSTPLHKTAQKETIDSHHPVSARKPRQLSGRHH